MFPIADAHCDTLSCIACEGISPEECMVTREGMEQGGVMLQTFALFGVGKEPPYARACTMLSQKDRVNVPLYLNALPEAFPASPHGILSIEGGEILEGSLERFHEFMRDARIRMIALTWNYENEIAFSAKSGSSQGLKPFGRRLLREMDEAGCLADVSHLNEAGFWDLIEQAELPPIASHSDCRALCDHFRNLTDEQIRALIERKSFLGINFYPYFLCEDGKASIEDVFRHIDHVAQMGGIGILGLGSDFDGIECQPEGLECSAHFPALMELLEKHGYTDSDLSAISHGNLWRTLKRAEAFAKKSYQ